MSMEGCPVCEHKERQSLEVQVLKGQLTKRDVAEIIGCRVDDVYDHMTKHLVKRQLKNVDAKRNVLLDSLQKLNSNIEHIVQEQQYGPLVTRQMVDISREVRQTIMSLDALEGNKPVEQHITIEQYNDFRSIIIANLPKLCPKCAETLLTALENEEKNRKVIDVEVQPRRISGKSS